MDILGCDFFCLLKRLQAPAGCLIRCIYVKQGVANSVGCGYILSPSPRLWTHGRAVRLVGWQSKYPEEFRIAFDLVLIVAAFIHFGVVCG